MNTIATPTHSFYSPAHTRTPLSLTLPHPHPHSHPRGGLDAPLVTPAWHRVIHMCAPGQGVFLF
jgi:hypothetical protein